MKLWVVFRAPRGRQYAYMMNRETGVAGVRGTGEVCWVVETYDRAEGNKSVDYVVCPPTVVCVEVERPAHTVYDLAGLVFDRSTRHTSLIPKPYVWGSRPSRSLKRRMASFDSEPCAPSPRRVTRDRSSIPGANASFIRPCRSSPNSFVRTPRIDVPSGLYTRPAPATSSPSLLRWRRHGRGRRGRCSAWPFAGAGGCERSGSRRRGASG